MAYGQDFQIAGLHEHCGLSLLRKIDGRYQWPHPVKPELVVTQNPNDPEDENFIAGLGSDVASVAHLHCRWEYFSPEIQKVVRGTLRRVTSIIVPAEFHRSEMKKHLLNGETRLRVASNGIRPDLFRPATQKERQEFKISNLLDPDVKLVGFAGRIETSKGIEVLKEICRQISDQPFALCIQFAAWHAFAAQNKWAETLEFVRELKTINPRKVIVWPDIGPRLNNRPVRFFDVFVTPSLSEVQPLVVLEALASGVPVVATKSTPFYEEIVERIPDLPSNSLQTIPLDKKFKRGAVSRDTTLEPEEARSLATKLIDRINAVAIGDYAQRERLSALILEAGYSEAAMNARISSIYDEAVNWMTGRQKGLSAGETYPLTGMYVDIAPADAGVVEYFRNETATSIYAAESGIQAALRRTVRRPKLSETHFRYEICANPKERTAELMRERKSIDGRRTVGR